MVLGLGPRELKESGWALQPPIIEHNQLNLHRAPNRSFIFRVHPDHQ